MCCLEACWVAERGCSPNHMVKSRPVSGSGRTSAPYSRPISWHSFALEVTMVDSYPEVKMERVDVPELVGDFLASLRTWISSGDVDLSAGLSLSKKSLDSLGAPLALLLEHGVIKECGPTSYKLPTPLVSHLREACRAHGRIDVERPKPDLSFDLAELCKRLQSSKAALEPSTLIKEGCGSACRCRLVAPTQRRQIRRLHPVPAALVIAPTLPGYDGDLPLLHDWSAAAVGLVEGEKRAAAGAEGAATERVAGAEPAPSLAAPDPGVDLALDPEQQQQQQQLAARLEALGTALGVGALSPAMYEQARRALVGFS